jgi:hypothetical protein
MNSSELTLSSQDIYQWPLIILPLDKFRSWKQSRSGVDVPLLASLVKVLLVWGRSLLRESVVIFLAPSAPRLAKLAMMGCGHLHSCRVSRIDCLHSWTIEAWYTHIDCRSAGELGKRSWYLSKLGKSLLRLMNRSARNSKSDEMLVAI